MAISRLRMALEGAKKVLGIEPFILVQLSISRQLNALSTSNTSNYNFAATQARRITLSMPVFESVFSMGVLYHQRDHMKHSI